MKKIFILTLIALTTLSIGAKSKLFFDAKSNILSITGDGEELASEGFGGKFFINDLDLGVDKSMYYDISSGFNEEAFLGALKTSAAANKIMKYLFVKNDSLSLDLVIERARINSQSSDEEIANVTNEGFDYLNSPEKIQDIINNNYLFYNIDRSWIVFRLKGDGQEIQKLFNLWNKGAAALDDIVVDIECVASGKSKESKVRNRMLRDIGKKVPAFAVRGQTVRINDNKGLYANIGTRSGLKKLDRMLIYKQEYKEDGTPVSKQVCTTRVVKADDNQARLFTVSGKWANTKRGDIAVLHNDAHQSSNIVVGYQNKAVDLYYQHESLLGMNQHGMGSYLVIRGGAGFFLPSVSELKEKENGYSVTHDDLKDYYGNAVFSYYDNNDNDKWDANEPGFVKYFDNWKKPIILNIGAGYGASWSLGHMVEIMPYAMGELQWLTASSKDKKIESYSALSIRMPVGVKVNLNIPSYKCQLTAGIEYNVFSYDPSTTPSTSKDKDGKYTTVFPTSWWDKCVAEPNNMSRKGIHFYAGIRFNY